jgi:hypothetical protein
VNIVWRSIKRNPIILAALAIVGIQLIQDWNNLTTQDWFQSLFTMGVAYLAREFTVPLREHEETKRRVTHLKKYEGGSNLD